MMRFFKILNLKCSESNENEVLITLQQMIHYHSRDLPRRFDNNREQPLENISIVFDENPNVFRTNKKTRFSLLELEYTMIRIPIDRAFD